MCLIQLFRDIFVPARFMGTLVTPGVNSLHYGCPKCDSSRRIQLHGRVTWFLAAGQRKWPVSEVIAGLAPRDDIQSMKIYKCKTCGENWSYDFVRQKMISISEYDVESLLRTDSETHTATAQQMLEMLAIKANPEVGSGEGCIRVPCEVTDKKGKLHEMASICFPIAFAELDESNYVGYIEDVVAIRPSKYTMPIEVRFATGCASEYAMGFSPTPVVSGKGRKFLLNGPNDFFRFKGIKGTEVSLYHGEPNYRSWPVARYNPKLESCFIADYQPECDNLLIRFADLEHPEELQNVQGIWVKTEVEGTQD